MQRWKSVAFLALAVVVLATVYRMFRSEYYTKGSYGGKRTSWATRPPMYKSAGGFWKRAEYFTKGSTGAPSGGKSSRGAKRTTALDNTMCDGLKVRLCENPLTENDGGTCVELGRGEYPEFASKNSTFGDNVTGIRIPPGMRVIVSDGPNFRKSGERANMWAYDGKQGQTDFRLAEGQGNDWVQSVRVECMLR